MPKKNDFALKISKEKLTKDLELAESLTDLKNKYNVSKHAIINACKRYNIDYNWYFSADRKVGKQYGSLTILEIIKYKYDKNRYHKYAKCQCVCKKELTLRLSSVVTLRTPSCGCIKNTRYSMVGDKNPQFKGVGKISKTWYNTKIIKAAAKRGLEVNINLQYVWRLYKKQKGLCALSGVPIYFGRSSYTHESTASLDRIDNNKGYVKGNVQWVHKDINRIKWVFTTETFLGLCKNVALHNKLITLEDLSDA